MRTCTSRLMNISRAKQRRSVLWRGSPIVASCLSRCARPGLGHIGLKEMMEHQNWIQDKFEFLRLHIRLKGLNKLSGFKSQARGASTSAHNISRASTDTDNMEISMQSTDTTLQPQLVTRPTTTSGCSLVDQQVMDQFKQMRSMLSSFLGQK